MSSNLRRLAFVFPMALVGLFYFLTICPTIYFGDGAELTAAAYVLGVPHPTGYPLYMLLGRIFLNTPFGSPGFRMNLLSAISMIASTGLFYLLLGELIGVCRKNSQNAYIVFRSAMAVAFGLSLFVWRHAVQTEVYGTFLALFLLSVWLIIRSISTGHVRLHLAAFFALGLTFQGHLLALILVPLYGVAVLKKLFRREFAIVLLAGVMFLIGIAGYAYLPIRARQHPPINWGAPTTVAALKDHLLGGQYRQTRILSAPGTLQPLRGRALEVYLRMQSLRIISWPAIQFNAQDEDSSAVAFSVIAGVLLWLMALAGLGLLFWKEPWIGFGVLCLILSSLTILVCYTIPDIEAYFIPLWAIAFGLIGLALVEIASVPKSKSVFRIMPPVIAIALAASAAANNYKACDLSDYTAAEDFGRRLMGETLPENSILVLQGDAAIFIAWYMQTVERLRPDVTIFGADFLVHGWYRYFFKRPQDKDFVFFARDTPPHAQPDYLVALGGGIIIPNIGRRPIVAVVPDPWLEQVLLANWNGKVIGEPMDASMPAPPIPAAWGPLKMIQLHDNPEYNAYQRRQFEEQYGSNVLLKGGE